MSHLKTIWSVALLMTIFYPLTPYANDEGEGVMPEAWHSMSGLSAEQAQRAAAAALRRCPADGYNVSVAITDRSGVLLALLRDSSAGPHTVGSSQGKAYASASTGQPTAAMAQAIADNPALQGLRDMDPRMVILAGGLPVVIGGQRVGGIGVGGAPGGHLDVACAQAGLKRIGAQF